MSQDNYSSFVYCKNCGSTHFQLIEKGKSLFAEPCNKCGVSKLKPSNHCPSKHGYRQLAGVWVSF